MARTKSITETGPKALRGVRNPDLYPSQSLGLSDIELQSLQDNLARSTYANYNVAHGHLGYQGLSDQSLYSPQITPELDYGSSTYDEGLLLDPVQQDIDNQRAENQSVLTKAAAGIAKGAILAGTTFINGTAGLLYGLGQGIHNTLDEDKDTSFSQGIWDNPITRLMGQINDAAERELVNYRTEEEINGPWYSLNNLTSANFIFDTVIKNMGFTVGAAFSGGVYTKAISWAAKALGLARLGQASAATIEAGQKAMQAANATRATKALVGSFFSAHAEAVQEAYNASQDFIRTSNQEIDSRAAEQKNLVLQEFLNKGGSILADGSPNPASDPRALSELEDKFQQINAASSAAKNEAIKQSKNVGTMDGLLNIPILWLSNVAMFGKMYSGGWKAAKNANRTTTRATKEALKEAEVAARAGDPSKLNKLNELIAKAEETGYQGLSQSEKALVEEAAPHLLGKKTGVAWAAAKGPLREGNEEMMQGAAAQAAHHRYENEVDRIFDAKLNLESTYKTRGLMESVMYGLKSQYGNIDNYEEAFVGAITGLLGSPTFGKRSNSTDQTYLGRSKWIGLSGGAVTEVKDYLRDRRTADLAAQHVTEVLRRENLSDDIKHLIAQTHFNDTMDGAVIHDDEKEYKDARTASIFEMVNHLKRAGRLDLLQRAMETTTQFTEEDIAEIAESVSKEVSATTPDISAKVQQKKRVEKEIEIILDQYGDLYKEAMATGDSSKIDVTSEMLEQKKAELAQLEAEIEQAKPVSVSPYIHKDGTAFTAEEIKQDIDKRVGQFQKIIDTIALAQDQIDEATSGTLTNEQLDTLTWYKVMMNDWNERADGITTQWNQLITKLAEDPKLVEAVQSIKEVEDLLEEAGFKPSEGNVQLGGRFDTLKKIKNYHNILQQLQEAVNSGGINLAYLLTSTVKPEGVDSTVGEIISKQLEQVLEADQSVSKDIKEAFIKNLNDLKSIGEGHRRYNELLDEYLKNPEAIDEAHEASTVRAERESQRQSMSSAIDGLDWNSPVGTIAKYLRDNASKIQSAGGFEEFIKNLTPEQQQKARDTQKLIMGIDSLDSLIDQAGLEDEQAQILRSIIDDSVDEASTIEQLVASVKEAIQNGDVEEAIRNNVPEDQAEDFILRQVEAAEVALSEFIDDNLKKLVDASEEAQRAIDAEQERVRQLADKTSEESDDAVEDLAKRTQESNDNLEAPAEGEVSQPDEDVPIINPTTATQARQSNRATKSPQAGEPGFNRRRQVSQYYLNGEDRETLPKHYEDHPEDIPAGVDKDAFLKYIKAVHKKLVDSGAYSYISTELKQGDVIEFITDLQLNEEAGIPVILMVTKGKDGRQQIIGTLPTSLDFQSKKRGSTKTIGELHPEDKALYDALVEELISSEDTTDDHSQKVSKITTKVEALRSGNPSWSSQNRSVASVFGENAIPITIISNDGRKSHSVKNPLDISDPINGQIYVYVDSNTGAQIPLLCFSTPIKDLDVNDWYIQQAVAAIQKLQDMTSVGQTKAELLKWLPFLNNLHINVVENRGVKSLLFGWGDTDANGHPVNTYSIKLQGDGFISTRDAQNFISTVAKRKVTLPSGEKIYPTTNVDHNKLNDSDYMSHIANYLKINLTEDSPRTIDDWFTYEPTEIQKKGRRSSQINPAVPSTGKRASKEVVETPTRRVIVSSAGTITTEDGSVLTAEEEADILANVPKGVDVSDVEKKPNESILERAFGFSASGVDDSMPDTKRRRRRKPKDDGTRFSLVPQETSQYTPEMQSIKDKAIADGTFMKAPNGNPTNLTERQWLQVRTKNFINWFGDWINNPSEASKVVDENGEPLVVYHGSPNNWNVYNPKLFASNTDEGDYGQGLYLSSIKSKAEQYGNIKELFVNSKIPFRAGLDPKIGSIQEITRRGKIVDMFGRDNAPEELKQYDSVLYTGREGKYEEIVITNPNQIKSATSNNGEFSTTNDDIRLLSQGATQDQIASQIKIQGDLDKLSAMFPKLAKEGRIVLVKGLLNVVDKSGNPRQAYGMFRNGVLYISDQSPKGTAFHEAFHYIANTLLSDTEWETMFDEATKLWGNLPEIELEENLAEAFREFMNERQDHSIKGRLKNIFQKLKHIVLSIVGRENYLDNLFWSIYRNKMQSRTDNTSQDTFKQELLEYKTKQLKYSNLDQETRDYLEARQFTEENYEKLSIEQKEILLQCM